MNQEQKRLATLNQKQIKTLYRDLFTSETGKLVLEHLRLGSYSYIPTWQTSEEGANKDHNEGKRSVILSIEMMMQQETEIKDE